MNKNHLFLFLPLLLSVAVLPAHAETVSRVSPASLPLPLPGTKALPPDQLRAQNPWNLPMTGLWRFQLTHGQIVAGHFVTGSLGDQFVNASSGENGNPPRNAFDGNANTRWCADSAAFPQQIQANLGQKRHVSGVTLTWEKPEERYRCRVEGSTDGKKWQMLADESAAPGIGDGPVSITPIETRFVRVVVLGTNGSNWASIRECKIHITDGGQDVVWTPPAPQPLPVSPHNDDFAQPSTDDQRWDNLAIPSNWEMAGYSVPTYNSVDDTVGLYRRWVMIPAAYTGRRIYWRFDGALVGAEVFVNGQKAGYHESGYTAFDVDVTGLVHPGKRNLFAVRVSKTTPSSDCETGDFQAMGGIYRYTSLIAVPATHIHDLTVRTTLAPNYRDATLATDVLVQGTPGEAVGVTGTLVGADGRKTPLRLAGAGRIGVDGTVTLPLSGPVTAPKLWSAEKPNLYYAILQLTHAGKPIERVEQRFGFRQIEIKNDVVLWNGQPIKCTGVCRHDFWADKGFALTDKEWRKDLTMMKAANINAIRTSHYNHAARFLELCEEQGFYILDEVPFCWINEKNNDPAFAPALLLRAADTLGRDKNRPCVLSWSLGNENGVGKNSQTVIDFVKSHEPTRPAFISQGGYWGPKGQSFQDMHYPTPADVDNYVAKDSGKLPAQFSEQPHIFYQKDAQDYDPGASDLWSETLTRTWAKIRKAPTILGSFIWEWQNQGIADKNPDRKRDFYYGPDRLRQENNKGVVDSYRNPKPEYWIVKMAYSPIGIETRTVTPTGRICLVALVNRYSFTDLSELACRWTAFGGEKALQTGIAHIACAPGSAVTASFPAPVGMTALRLEFIRPNGVAVTLARLAVPGAPAPTPPHSLVNGGSLTTQGEGGITRVGNALVQVMFDTQAGTIHSWRVGGRDVLTAGPALALGESRAGNEKGYYHAAQPPVLGGTVVTTDDQSDGSVRFGVTAPVQASAGGQTLGTLAVTYDVRPTGEIAVHWTLNWTAPETNLWEVGMTVALPAADTHMGWWRDSFFTVYPAGHLGEPIGTAKAGDTLFRSSKRGLHWMTLTDTAGTGLALLEESSPLTARAVPTAEGITLFASREVAVSKEFSGTWVSDHDILATPGKSLTGSFVLRAVAVGQAEARR
jgi:beta-galactosidase